MMKTCLTYLTILFLLSVYSECYSQSTGYLLIQKINKDSEWNLPNYFDRIDEAVSSDCKKSDKATLLLLKAKYYSAVQQYDKALKAIKQSERLLDHSYASDSVRALIHLRKSGYYAQMNNFSYAFQEWVKCNNYYTAQKNYDGISYTQQVLALFFIQLNQKKYAKKALDRAKRYAIINKNKTVLSALYSCYSNYWGTNGNLDSSLYYFQLSEQFESFKEHNFTKDYSKAVIYLNKGDLANARLYFQECINKAEKVHCNGYIGVATYGLAITYLDEDLDKSFLLMKKAFSLIEDNNPDLGIMICDCILNSFKGQQYADLLPFFEKRNLQLKKEREKIDEAQVGQLLLMTSSSNESLMRTQNELVVRKEHEYEQKLFIRITLILGFSLCIILGIIIHYYRKGVKSQRKLNTEYENQKQLFTHSLLTITRHNATAENLSKKLKGMALQQTSKKLSDDLYALSKSVDENALGAKSKELKDLDYMIRSINDGFVKRLCSTFENLTASEITLAIYLRMNFTTKQIAELKGTSENSIDVARSRLRSKIGIKGENTDLSTYLNKI
jgi:tetratricopeptide (TPR) repeat protein